MRRSAALLALLALLLPATALRAQGPPDAVPVPHVKVLADSVAGTGSILGRTRRLVHWINDTFEWSATDYQRRSPAQIIARRAGNCSELASVLDMFLDSLGIRTRWVREINVQPARTERRQRTADSLVKARGNSFSVFGLQHNDHVWLEVWDETAGAWFPADPAYGVVGIAEWSAARLAMAGRPRPRVAAVEPIAADMVVPFVVVAGDRRNGPYDVDLTSLYLVDGFDRLYGSGLSTLPSWPRWVELVRSLSPRARAAFEGRENLHESTEDIAQLKATYDLLGREAAARRLTWR
jgi:hypothetical protein